MSAFPPPRKASALNFRYCFNPTTLNCWLYCRIKQLTLSLDSILQRKMEFSHFHLKNELVYRNQNVNLRAKFWIWLICERYNVVSCSLKSVYSHNFLHLQGFIVCREPKNDKKQFSKRKTRISHSVFISPSYYGACPIYKKIILWFL